MDNIIHDTKRIGLIIQGPMLSSGVKGPLLRDKNSIKEKNDKNYVEFNCLKNVVKLAESGKKYFNYIVLSTWESDFDFVLLKNNFFDKIIISNEENFENIYIKNKIFNQNYKKQFHTIKMASNFLKDKDLDFIVKIRTDLEIDIDKLYDECLYAISKNKTLINNGIRSSSRFLEIDDFIFGSKSDLFIKWMDNLVNIEFGKPAGAHSNLMISYLWTKYKSKSYLKNIHYFHKSIENNSKTINKLAIKEWNDFHILGKKFWNNSKLRGEKLDSRYYDFKICEPKIKKHKINYDFKAYVKWMKSDFNLQSNV